MSSDGDTWKGVNGYLDENEALEAAIAMSLASSTTPTAPSPAFGSMKLDRKKMEEERLARQKKRSVEQAGLSESPVSKRPPPHSMQNVRVPRSLPDAGGPLRQHRAGESSGAPLPFAKGVVKRTWALGCPKSGDEVKIEEIFDRDHLELAVLSSFQWDESWIFSKLDIARTKVILVAFANNEAQQKEMRSNVPSERIRFCFPKMSGGGYMHSKLQLLKFKSHLRVVVPSGNLVPYDWGETGQLENMVFIIDLPRSEHPPENVALHKEVETLFKTSLREFLIAQGLDDALIQGLDKYDFSETRRYGFIHSISGPHMDVAARKTGYCGLGKTVTALGLQNEGPLDVHYLTSSLGSLDNTYLKLLYYACQGDDGMKEYHERQSMQRKGKLSTTSTGRMLLSDGREILLKDHFRAYFPSAATVSASRGGYNSGGTICFQEKWWKASTFPREVVRDSVNTRAGVLMHSKAMYVHGASPNQTAPAWAYVGSANLSESAWGRLVKDRGTGTEKLNCRNWECGVLFPVDRSKSHHTGKGDLAIFRDTVPVPMDTGCTALGNAEGHRRPWFFQSHV